MITVGVRDLKISFLSIFNMLKMGKIIVTEHNRIIAEIIVPEKEKYKSTYRAAESQGIKPSPRIKVLKRFEQLKREGKMILSKRNETLVEKPQITEKEKKIEWESVYNDVRSDRF